MQVLLDGGIFYWLKVISNWLTILFTLKYMIRILKGKPIRDLIMAKLKGKTVII